MHIENAQLCQCHVIVIAVKPYLVAKVMGEIKGHLKSHHVIVSLAAGVKLADLSKVSAIVISILSKYIYIYLRLSTDHMPKWTGSFKKNQGWLWQSGWSSFGQCTFAKVAIHFPLTL